MVVMVIGVASGVDVAILVGVTVGVKAGGLSTTVAWVWVFEGWAWFDFDVWGVHAPASRIIRMNKRDIFRYIDSLLLCIYRYYRAEGGRLQYWFVIRGGDHRPHARRSIFGLRPAPDESGYITTVDHRRDAIFCVSTRVGWWFRRGHDISCPYMRDAFPLSRPLPGPPPNAVR